MKPVWIALIMLTAAFASCSKDKDKQRDCRISSISDVSPVGASVFTYAYDEQGRIDSIQIAGTSARTKRFSYNGNSVVMQNISNGVITQVDSNVLNANGLVEYHHSRVYGSGELNITRYNYNSAGELTVSPNQESSGASIVTTSYLYSNGDLLAATSPSGTITYTYYDDKPAVTGEYLSLNQVLLTGAVYLKPKHLVKSTGSGGDPVAFSYTFDGNGNIKSFTAQLGTFTEVATYTLDCR